MGTMVEIHLGGAGAVTTGGVIAIAAAASVDGGVDGVPGVVRIGGLERSIAPQPAGVLRFRAICAASCPDAMARARAMRTGSSWTDVAEEKDGSLASSTASSSAVIRGCVDMEVSAVAREPIHPTEATASCRSYDSRRERGSQSTSRNDDKPGLQPAGNNRRW